MTSRKKQLCVGAAILVLSCVRIASWAAEEGQPVVQIAILLDTSNSMDGLIAQAKSELWRVVNEFVTAKRDGKRPEFQVALYEYGKNSIPANEGYLRMILPLTTDLDEVSKQLFALTTKGGDEYCGKVIRAAVEGLAWSKSSDDLKLIFIAGNEPFTQGDMDYRQSCKAAIEKGIIVNTIFCGAQSEGIATKWQDGALLAEGKYMNIDQNRSTVHVDAPQDREIVRLGEELNKTYVPFGAQGQAGIQRQAAQEANARAAAPASAVERQVTKSSAFYRNAAWDLVDAAKEGRAKLDELKTDDLPENMRKMSADERKAHVESQAGRRTELQGQINKLSEERKQYVAQKMKDAAASGASTLDAAMIRAVREQAAKKNMKFQ
jgi:hypothetical protein